MYGLDVNFLKDREIRPVEAARPGQAAAAQPGDRRPLIMGLVAAAAALGLVGGYGLLLRQQIRQLQAEEAEIDQQIAEVQGQLAQLDAIQAQTQIVEAENQAFVNVFNQIRPWSAFLKELRDRTPVRIQITSVDQTAGEVVPGQPVETDAEGNEIEPSLPPAGGVDIEGIACSFNDINDFVLTLQRSPLLDGQSVVIDTSEKQNELLDPEVQGVCPNTPADSPEFLVDFTIQANFSDVPSAELLDILDRQGAVGLATRIRALRDAGVIETTP